MPHGWSHRHMSLRLAQGVDGSYYSFFRAHIWLPIGPLSANLEGLFDGFSCLV